MALSQTHLIIGFTLGLLGLPVVPVIALIAVQTFLVRQVGMRIGQRIGERAREGAERLAGVALGLLAIGLLIAKPHGVARLRQRASRELPFDVDMGSIGGADPVGWVSWLGVGPAGVATSASRSISRSTAPWSPSTAARSSSLSEISTSIRRNPSLASSSCASLDGFGR
ncbi:MAG: manganese efflux pump [Solirubrobacteraceae bacterium]